MHARGGDRTAYLPVANAVGTRIDGDPIALARAYVEQLGVRELYVADLDAIAGGDEQTALAWLRNESLALGGVPVVLIESVPGLVSVVGYLDARRAIV